MAERALDASLRRGVTVIVALGVLTVVEFVVAVNAGPIANLLLAVTAIVKAYLIVREFMHLAQLWGTNS